MRLAVAALGLVALAACNQHEAVSASGDPIAVGDPTSAADAADSRRSDPAPGDTNLRTETGPGDPDGRNYRSSLSVCWTDAMCPRVMSVAHGGAWDLSSAPYDSNAAIAAAYADGVDGVKVDVRVTADNVPVIAHSSPITYYESLDCYNRKIEEMTAAQVTSCHRLPSTTEIFQRLDDVLDYLRGKMVVQLCVKRPSDYGRTIAEIQTKDAEDFAFLEISTSELQGLIPTLPGSDTVYYLVNVGTNVAEVDTLLDVIQNPRAFMVEFDPSVTVATLTQTRLHPGGVRSFTYDSAVPISVQKIQAYFEGGYDVVSSQAAANSVQARKNVNTDRGVSPP
jgi:glycerophosphoryl diester phosphodiesterase